MPPPTRKRLAFFLENQSLIRRRLTGIGSPKYVCGRAFSSFKRLNIQSPVFTSISKRLQSCIALSSICEQKRIFFFPVFKRARLGISSGDRGVKRNLRKKNSVLLKSRSLPKRFNGSSSVEKVRWKKSVFSSSERRAKCKSNFSFNVSSDFFR